jgi:hypothetical protein
VNFNLLVVLIVAGLGVLWILRSPLLKAIVLDTLRHPNRAALFEVLESGVVKVVPVAKVPAANANGKVSYVETVGYTIVLHEPNVVPANWPRLAVIASSTPQQLHRAG